MILHLKRESNDVDENGAEQHREGDIIIIGEKRRNGKLRRLRKQEGLLLLDDTTFQTALLETNNPTTKYKLLSLIETDAKSFWWEEKARFHRVEQSPPSTCIYTFRHCDYKFKIGAIRILLSENTFD